MKPKLCVGNSLIPIHIPPTRLTLLGYARQCAATSCHTCDKAQPTYSSKVKVAGAEESDKTDDDQIYGDDKVEQTRHDKNENPGDQGYQGSKTEVDIHENTFSFR